MSQSMPTTSSPLPWILAIVFGCIGIAVSGALFFAMLLFTNSVFGILVAVFGVLTGFLTALGFKLGKGSFPTEKSVTLFLHLATVFGFLGVAAGYGVIMGLAWIGGETQAWNVLSPIDLLFAAIGAYGGRWAGEKFLIRTINTQEAVKLEQAGVVESIDSKFDAKFSDKPKQVEPHA